MEIQEPHVEITKCGNRYEVEVFIHFPWEDGPKGRKLERDFLTKWGARLQARWHLKNVAWPLTYEYRGDRKLVEVIKTKGRSHEDNQR